MKTLSINVGKGHVCVTDKQLTVWLYTVLGSAKLTLAALRTVKATRKMPDFFTPSKNTHAARQQLAMSIALCAARHEGKTAKFLGNTPSAHNWNVL